MKMKRVTVQDYINKFGLRVICGFGSVSQRTITDISINRPGFELSGFFEATVKSRIVMMGHKELTYIKASKKEDLIKAYDFLTSDECPAIVICRNLDCPEELLKIAQEKDFPILLTTMGASELTNLSFTYLQEVLAPTKSIHASLVEIYSVGVLLIGESGIGKSETTLELLNKGHHLVADDRVDISLVRNELIGTAPELLKGVMEVRGIGIIDVGKLFGINYLLDKKKISYAIELIPYDKAENYDRLGNNFKYLDILGYNVPLVKIPVFGARSVADIIEIAVTNLKLKENGFDSAYEFENRMNELLKRK